MFIGMRTLKALVIFMGVLIIAGFIVIVVTIFNRSQVATQKPSLSKIVLPTESEIIEMIALDKKLAVHLRLSDGSHVLHIFELSDDLAVSKIYLEIP